MKKGIETMMQVDLEFGALLACTCAWTRTCTCTWACACTWTCTCISIGTACGPALGPVLALALGTVCGTPHAGQCTCILYCMWTCTCTWAYTCADDDGDDDDALRSPMSYSKFIKILRGWGIEGKGDVVVSRVPTNM